MSKDRDERGRERLGAVALRHVRRERVIAEIRQGLKEELRERQARW